MLLRLPQAWLFKTSIKPTGDMVGNKTAEKIFIMTMTYIQQECRGVATGRTRGHVNFYFLCSGQFTSAFHFLFFNYIGEIDHFTLDLLKRSDT